MILADAGVRVLVMAPSYRGRNYLDEARNIAGPLVANFVSAPPNAPPRMADVRWCGADAR